jgi:hypothetical protein
LDEGRWDDVEGEIDPKSKKGARDVPVAAVLRRYLLEQRARTGRRSSDLFFGRTATAAFMPSPVRIWISTASCASPASLSSALCRR